MACKAVLFVTSERGLCDKPEWTGTYNVCRVVEHVD